MAVWLPFPEQPHSVSQNSPMKLPSQAQEPALQESAARAAVMFVCVPWPLQSHSSFWQYGRPIQSPQLAQVAPSADAPPWSVQLPSQRVPA